MLDKHKVLFSSEYINAITKLQSSKKVIKTASINDEIRSLINNDFIDHIDKIKLANLQKESMAQTIGQKDMDRSWNIEYKMSELSDREQQIKTDIERQFAPYLYEEIREKGIRARTTALPAGLFGKKEEGDSIELTGDPLDPKATLVMRFGFNRKIVPLEHVNKEAHTKATTAISTLDSIAPGFKDLVDILESSNIPLNPYFHTSVFSYEQGGNLTAQSLQAFFERERQRYAGQGVNGVYNKHLDSIENKKGRGIVPTPNKSDRIFSNEEIPNISYKPYLISGLVSKIKDNYTLDTEGLKRSIEELKQSWFNQLGLSNLQSPTKQQADSIRSHEHYHSKMFNNIVKYFNSGCAWQSGEPDVPNRYVIEHDVPSSKYRAFQGEQTNTKHGHCPDLTLQELGLLLRNCTKSNGNSSISPDQFIVPGYTMTHMSNGMDFDHTGTARMLSTPAIRTLPSHNKSQTDSKNRKILDVIYDPDNGNIGRDHLIKNWVQDNGGLKTLFQNGEKYLQIFNALRNPSVVKNLPPHVSMAWSTIMKNRTNAETVLDMINKYTDYDSFYRGTLRVSYPSLRRLYEQSAARINNIRDPSMISDPMDRAVFQYQQDGDWDAFSQSAFSSLTNTDTKTMMPKEDYALYRKYAYPIAKLLDLLSALMYASCEEDEHKLSGRSGQQIPIKLYGRNYSTSSGKGGGGEIMIGLKYAFAAPEITDNPDILKMLKQEYRSRTSIARPKGTTPMRVTRFPENAQNIYEPLPDHEEYYQSTNMPGTETPIDLVNIQIVEDLTYFVGMSGKVGGMIKDVTSPTVDKHDWISVLDDFRQRFPDLEDQVQSIISPINRKFRDVEMAVKKSINNVRQKIESQLQRQGVPVNIGIFYQKSTGEGEALSSASASSEFQNELESLNQEQEVQQPPMGQNDFDQYDTDIQTNQQTSTTLLENEEEDDDFKSMEMPPVNYLRKNKGNRTLFKQNPHEGKLSKSTAIERIIKISNMLDEQGFPQLANKFDEILYKL